MFCLLFFYEGRRRMVVFEGEEVVTEGDILTELEDLSQKKFGAAFVEPSLENPLFLLEAVRHLADDSEVKIIGYFPEAICEVEKQGEYEY